jgi:hypothetical protein
LGRRPYTIFVHSRPTPRPVPHGGPHEFTEARSGNEGGGDLRRGWCGHNTSSPPFNGGEELVIRRISARHGGGVESRLPLAGSPGSVLASPCQRESPCHCERKARATPKRRSSGRFVAVCVKRVGSDNCGESSGAVGFLGGSDKSPAGRRAGQERIDDARPRRSPMNRTPSLQQRAQRRFPTRSHQLPRIGRDWRIAIGIAWPARRERIRQTEVRACPTVRGTGRVPCLRYGLVPGFYSCLVGTGCTGTEYLTD